MNASRAAALAALSLAACSFAPPVRRPDVPLPDTHRFVDTKETASIADLPWWEVFRDPTLQGLIREAIGANLDLKLATARVEEASALVGVAGAGRFPQINGQASGAHGQLVSKEILPGSEVGSRFNVLGTLSWELDIWGRNRNARAAAVADLLATDHGRRAVVLTLVSAVAQAYLELRELDLELAINRANSEVRRGTLQLFEARSRGGVGSDLEVEQAKSDLALTRAAIPAAEQLVAIKENQISVLLGRSPGAVARGAELTSTPLPPELPTGVPAALLTRRPDLLQAEMAVRAAGARVGVAVANRLPQLSLTGFLGFDARSLSRLFDSDAFTWSVGGGLLAPIFQGGQLSSAEQAARAVLSESVISYRQTVLNALREVADAVVSVRSVRQVRDETAREAAAAEKAAQLALLRYEGGVSTYLEVLDAQRRSYSAQLDKARVERDLLVSVVQLYRALGGGWQEAPAESSATEQGATPFEG